jgi:predicted RNase H-like HicB family nuclease
MHRQLTAIVEREGDGYVSLCPELDIASQGATIEEARENLREALELLLDVEPVPGATAIQCIEADDKGMVYGITDDSVFFVFDANTKEVSGRLDLKAEHGSPLLPDQSFINGPRGDRYMVMEQSIFRIDRERDLPVKILDMPVEGDVGLGLIDSRLYLGADTHLRSVSLQEK